MRPKNTIPKEITFLILDDEEMVRNNIMSVLRKLDFTGNLLEADTVSNAKKILKEHRVDFILSDWNLPDGTGHDFLIEVRRNKKYSKTPFVLISIRDDINDILNAIKDGASNYIIKSNISGEDFLEKLNYSWQKSLSSPRLSK